MGDLPQRDRRRFMGLGMGPQPDAGGTRQAGHLREIALEGIEVDDQRRRVDLIDRSADIGGKALPLEPASVGTT
jgi:hypothetical protein